MKGKLEEMEDEGPNKRNKMEKVEKEEIEDEGRVG